MSKLVSALGVVLVLLFAGVASATYPVQQIQFSTGHCGLYQPVQQVVTPVYPYAQSVQFVTTPYGVQRVVFPQFVVNPYKVYGQKVIVQQQKVYPVQKVQKVQKVITY